LAGALSFEVQLYFDSGCGIDASPAFMEYRYGLAEKIALMQIQTGRTVPLNISKNRFFFSPKHT
jgi:hypothetical protein